ncbi:MAG: hypothetical protein ABIO72_00515 [Patescibacteria group bacterium]
MKTYTGAYGIVALPGETVDRWVRGLGKLPLGTGPDARPAQFSTKIAHITLYHGKLANVPQEVVAMLLRSLEPLKHHNSYGFTKIEEFGKRFLFLDVEATPLLQAAHLIALHLSNYLDRSSPPKAKEEGLELNAKEARQLERYGHPLTFDRFRPHFTLAYDEGGFAQYSKLGPTPATLGNIRNFAFAKIGEYGAVEELVEI